MSRYNFPPRHNPHSSRYEKKPKKSFREGKKQQEENLLTLREGEEGGAAEGFFYEKVIKISKGLLMRLLINQQFTHLVHSCRQILNH